MDMVLQGVKIQRSPNLKLLGAVLRMPLAQTEFKLFSTNGTWGLLSPNGVDLV